jgi:hypothetical protein
MLTPLAPITGTNRPGSIVVMPILHGDKIPASGEKGAPTIRTSGRIRRHVMLGMNTIISSTGSCYVTPGKHRLLRPFRASHVSIAWHDPEAERSSPDSCEGGSEEKICPRIGQSVTVIDQDKAILILFVLSREDVLLMLGIRPSCWTLPIMRGNNA